MVVDEFRGICLLLRLKVGNLKNVYHFELRDIPNELLTDVTKILVNDSRVSYCHTPLPIVLLFIDHISLTAAEESSSLEIILVPKRSLLAKTVVIGM